MTCDVASPGNTGNFRLALPASWNGKYCFQGVGGLGGAIGSLPTGLARGYASASTDTGRAAANSAWASGHDVGDLSPLEPAPRPFARSGGKLVVYHG